MDDERTEYEKSIRKPEDIDFEDIKSETDDYESSPPQYEITTYPADFTLQGLYDKWNEDEIEVPKFQRQFVWKQVQSSKLIESFLVGLPVPAIFLYTEKQSQKYLVIDGQQRLKSVFYFFDGFFGEELKGKRKKFDLKGLSPKSKWNGKTFQELDEIDKRKLKNSILRSFIVQQLDPKDETSIYHIFERLNTGGTQLTNQEVRNCVYGGKLNDLLIDLNKYPTWRKILGKPIPDSRQKDIELMLRFFSLRKREEYEKPLKDFISKFMRRNRAPSPEFIDSLRNMFQNTCNSVLSKLGEKPFHIKAGLNSAVFDSVMVNFSTHLNNIPEDINKRYERLILDEDFYKKYCSRATTDEETVRNRFLLAEKYLFTE